jgi:hypothetical protein
MEYSPRLFSAVDGSAPRHTSMPPVRDHRDVSPSVQRDLLVARTTRANTLLAGTDRLVTKLLPFAVPELTHAAIVWCKEGPLRLLPSSMGVGTVVLRDVDALTREDQRRLCDWIDYRRSGIQVVSTTSASLLSLVEMRAFDDELYYRLNMIYIELAE